MYIYRNEQGVDQYYIPPADNEPSFLGPAQPQYLDDTGTAGEDDDEEDDDDEGGDAYDAMRPYNQVMMAASNESSPNRRGVDPQLDVSLPFIKNSSHPANAADTPLTE